MLPFFYAIMTKREANTDSSQCTKLHIRTRNKHFALLCMHRKSSPTQGYSQYPSFQTFHHFWSILHSCLKAVVERVGSPSSGIRWLTTSSIPFSSQNFFFSGEQPSLFTKKMPIAKGYPRVYMFSEEGIKRVTGSI